jgi:hypothetical protein
VNKKPLIATNPYLKNPATRQKLFLLSALTSTAVEGVHLSQKTVSYKLSEKKAVYYKTAKSAKSKH